METQTEWLGFIAHVVDDGITAAIRDYGQGSEKARGAEAGFELCRNRPPERLMAVLATARADQQAALQREAEDYWFWACRAAEVEWVINCAAAAQVTLGQPPLMTPTTQGMQKAIEILITRARLD